MNQQIARLTACILFFAGTHTLSTCKSRLGRSNLEGGKTVNVLPGPPPAPQELKDSVKFGSILPDSNYDGKLLKIVHTETCRQMLGEIPPIDCDDGVGEMTVPKFDEKGVCLNPSIVGNTGCSKSRLKKFQNGSVYWVALCRPARDNGLIGWDSASGKACFFNKPTNNPRLSQKAYEERLQPIKLADYAISPDNKNTNTLERALTDWGYPDGFVNDEACTSCHQGSDPWIVSSYLKDAWVNLKIPRQLKHDQTPENYHYEILGLGRHDWGHGGELLKLDACTGCHDLAITQTGRGRVVASSVGLKAAKAWMPPSSDKNIQERAAYEIGNCLRREPQHFNGSKHYPTSCTEGIIRWTPKPSAECLALHSPKRQPTQIQITKTNSPSSERMITLTWDLQNAYPATVGNFYDMVGFQVSSDTINGLATYGHIQSKIRRTIGELARNGKLQFSFTAQLGQKIVLDVKPFVECSTTGSPTKDITIAQTANENNVEIIIQDPK